MMTVATIVVLILPNEQTASAPIHPTSIPRDAARRAITIVASSDESSVFTTLQ